MAAFLPAALYGCQNQLNDSGSKKKDGKPQ
jgi:hypothetical protein